MWSPGYYCFGSKIKFWKRQFSIISKYYFKWFIWYKLNEISVFKSDCSSLAPSLTRGLIGQLGTSWSLNHLLSDKLFQAPNLSKNWHRCVTYVEFREFWESFLNIINFVGIACRKFVLNLKWSFCNIMRCRTLICYPGWMMYHKYEYFLDRKESSKGTFRYLTELISNQTIYHLSINFMTTWQPLLSPRQIIMWWSPRQSRGLS